MFMKGLDYSINQRYSMPLAEQYETSAAFFEATIEAIRRAGRETRECINIRFHQIRDQMIEDGQIKLELIYPRPVKRLSKSY